MRPHTIATALLLGFSGAAHAVTYSISSIQVTDLGTNGGHASAAYGINDHGDIVGWADDSNDKQRPMIFRNGAMSFVDAGVVPYVFGAAYDINNSRIVVGQYVVLGGPIQNYAFRWSPGSTMVALETDVAPGLGLWWETYASAINNGGRVAGMAARAPGSPNPPDTGQLCYDNLPVVWASTAAGSYPMKLFCIQDFDQDENMDLEGTFPWAQDINESGNTVGTDAMSTPYSMFLVRNGLRTMVPPPAGVNKFDANNVPLYGRADGISDQNWVVGSFRYYGGGVPASGRRAFFWDTLTPESQNLGVLSGGTWSAASAINESKMVVGTSQRKIINIWLRDAGFIWHPNFGMKALPAPPYSGLVQGDCYAWAVNELDAMGVVQIAGGCEVSGQLHAVRWDVHITTSP